jgi:GTP-binding protein Era
MTPKKLTSENSFRCGTVAIIGRPNVGKSTLLNQLLGEKVAIVTNIPQTTRHQIRGILTQERGQIIFIDTPGLHRAKDQLDKFMNRSSDGTFTEVDCIIYLVDTSRKIGEEEESIAQKLKDVKCPVILGLNKVDLKAPHLPEYIAFWEKVKGKSITKLKKFSMVALSGEKGINMEELINVVFSYLPKGPALYPEDVISDLPQKMMIADIIREKLWLSLREEVPHSLCVVIEHLQHKKKITHIKALILVERDTQKEIVIGKRGEFLKKAGTLARQELEGILDAKVFLELYVKTQSRWRDDVPLLQDLGYVFS